MRKKLLGPLLLSLSLLLGACSLMNSSSAEGGAPAQTPEPDAPEAETPAPEPEQPPVRFAAGEVPADTRELTLVLQPGETALLEELKRGR